MSSCLDLRSQLAKFRNLSLSPKFQKLLSECRASTLKEFDQFKQEFQQAAEEDIRENTESLKSLIRELDYEGELNLSHITDHTQLQEKNGFIFPRSISWNLNLLGLTSVEGLVLPKAIERNLNLSSLTSTEGLVLPEKVGGELHLGGLKSAKGLVLPKEFRDLNLSGLTNAEGLVLPEKIDGSLNLNGLASAEGLVLPKRIKGDLHLDGLKSAKGLVLPKIIIWLPLKIRKLFFEREIGGSVYTSYKIYSELKLMLTPAEFQRYYFMTE